MWLFLIIYLVIGLVRVGYDFMQPYFNQPMYITEKRWGRIFLYILFWPYLVIVSRDIHYFIMSVKNKFHSHTLAGYQKKIFVFGKLILVGIPLFILLLLVSIISKWPLGLSILIGTILLAVFHSPFWLIPVAVLAVFLTQCYRYYASTPWRRVFYRVRTIYDIEMAKAAAQDPELASSHTKCISFHKRFYRAIYPSLQDDEIQQRFDQIEEYITNISDHDGIENILRRKFSKTDEQRMHRVLDAFKSEITHIDNRLAMLKIFVMADIIGRETNNQNRLEFLYTVLAEPKTINF